jgi:DNA-3-methyladenine glycosylase II
MRVLVRSVGVQAPRRGIVGFEGLASSILYQQISGAAGDAIVRKLRAHARATHLPPADWFAEVSDATLRSCGVSPQKQRYLRDLAARTLDGRLDFPGLKDEQDEEVLSRLIEVVGIGRWTAEMYLIFALRRPDILPVDDLGIRKAVQSAYGFRALPSASTILRLGEPWRPWRSYATHYLWRSLERPSWEGLEEARSAVRPPRGARAKRGLK